MDASVSAQIKDAAKQELKDCAKFLFFDEAGTVLAANFKVTRQQQQRVKHHGCHEADVSTDQLIRASRVALGPTG